MKSRVVVNSSFGRSELYSDVLLRADLLLARAQAAGTVREALRLLELLAPDDYTRYLIDYYRAGLDRIGDDWDYADIITMLIAASRTIQPANYLEIGVRRGRSVAAVVTQCPTVTVYAADLWMQNYGNNPNPGPDFVTAELARCSYHTPLNFLNGDSRVTIPKLLRQHPELRFDLITVDGDHSYDGALTDLRHVLPALSLGGVLVFDDIAHPRHPALLKAWRTAIAEDGGISAIEYSGLGYGVAVGIRHWPVGGAPRMKLAANVKGALQRVPGLRQLSRKVAAALNFFA